MTVRYQHQRDPQDAFRVRLRELAGESGALWVSEANRAVAA